jgi:hypothetical protein
MASGRPSLETSEDTCFILLDDVLFFPFFCVVINIAGP